MDSLPGAGWCGYDLGMKLYLRICALAVVACGGALAAVDVKQTLALLEEGERLTTPAVAELERKIEQEPRDLEGRLRLLAYYSGAVGASEPERARAARARHVVWLVEHEPKAAVFELATRVYAIQPAGGALADEAGFQAMRAAWAKQVAARPDDAQVKRNAASALDVHDPETVEKLLTAIRDERWLGQLYARAVLGVAAWEERTGAAVLTSEERRNGAFAQRAREAVGRSRSGALVGGAALALCRDGGLLYANGKLDWDYSPLAKEWLKAAERLDPSNPDVFATVAEKPRRGVAPPVTVRMGGNNTAQMLRKRVDPVVLPNVDARGQVVRLLVLIGLDGKVAKARAVEGAAALRRACEDAVKEWRYSPVSLGGGPVYVLTSVEFKF